MITTETTSFNSLLMHDSNFLELLNHAWKQFLSLSEQQFGKRVVDTWLRSLSLYSWEKSSSIVILKTPNSFVKDWLEKNYIVQCQSIFARIFNCSFVTIKLLVTETTPKDEKKKEYTHIPLKDSIASKAFALKKKILSSGIVNHSTVNPSNTFDSFIVGNGNEVVFSAIKYFMNDPQSHYNPLFICSKSGLGKTHLLHAIENFIKKNMKEIICVYQTADNFIKNYIQSVKTNNLDQFEEYFKNIDIFLLDDIQDFIRKDRTQQIFLNIINNMQQESKKIIITSNKYPHEVKGLSEEIKSRCEGGLVLDLKLPEQNVLIKIIQNKATLYGLTLNYDIALLIANSNITSIREIEGIITRIAAYSNLIKQEITVEMIHELLDYKEIKYEHDFMTTKIISLVENSFNVSFHDMKSTKRTKNIVEARHIGMYLLKKHLNKTYEDIRVQFKRADHTTVLHAYKKMEKQAATNSKLLDIERIILQLTTHKKLKKDIDIDLTDPKKLFYTTH